MFFTAIKQFTNFPSGWKLFSKDQQHDKEILLRDWCLRAVLHSKGAYIYMTRNSPDGLILESRCTENLPLWTLMTSKKELNDYHTDYNLGLGTEEVQQIQQKLSSLKIQIHVSRSEKTSSSASHSKGDHRPPGPSGASTSSEVSSARVRGVWCGMS
ncbi:hypothetical protein CEXT_477221 [Caerostris extrusa]|uniref:Uncharacterized protein n=1 Tax=Caerostris extrusa TaxID=172846 RepID=A0AAV4T1W6_CAEEX|nr:hypothetical protein CEXT_477221 [Caerostris extrusa]